MGRDAAPWWLVDDTTGRTAYGGESLAAARLRAEALADRSTYANHGETLEQRENVYSRMKMQRAEPSLPVRGPEPGQRRRRGMSAAERRAFLHARRIIR